MSAADPSKRVFMTTGDSSELLKKPDKNTGTTNGKSKSLRLELELFEPDEYKFPEFNYKKLVHIEKKKQKKIAKLPNGNHDDPLGGGDEDDVARITRELEAKYGSGSAYGKASRLTIVDRGAGYDATDSFIDDTENYDELIPDEIETDRGGFYINSGSLEFKKLSNFERPGDEIRMPKAKKRALSTSSESSASDGAEEEKAPEKTKKKKVHAEKKIKTTTNSSSDEQGKAKKAKKEKNEKPKDVPKEVQPPKEPEKKKPLEMKTTTVKDMLRAKRDNMLKKELGKPTSSGATTATDNDDEDDVSDSANSMAGSESSRDSHRETAPVNGSKDVSLPENLPADIYALINHLKQQAEACANNKGNFFVGGVLDQLVKIDNNVKSLGVACRIQTFKYLEQIVPCTKKTLFAKVRKHRVHQFNIKLKNEISKLRKIVEETMPALQSKFDQDTKQFESRKTVQSVIGGTPFDQNPPRRKYQWTENSRMVINEILNHLRDMFKIVKKKKDLELDFITGKLKSDVVPLWPEGWIRLEDINKEIERRRKKDTRAIALAAAATPPETASQVQSKHNTAAASNGKLPVQAQKTEQYAKNDELELPIVNGKSSSLKIPAPSASPSSVIKRSSDHSINSIISASPSPPTTSQSLKLQEPCKPRVIELDKLVNPSDLLKVAHPKNAIPKFSTIDITTPEKVEKVRRSESSDSDCVEVVGEFNPIKPAKSQHNNKASHSHPAPVAKKAAKKHGSDGEPAADYSQIIMGLQSLTDHKKPYQLSVQSTLASPVGQQLQQRKAETSHGQFDANGTSEHFADSKVPGKASSLHYPIGEFIANSNRNDHEGSIIKRHVKSSDHHKPSLHYNHHLQLNSSTNNNLHSISMSLTPPSIQSSNHDRKASPYMMPSILNLSNKK